MQVVLVHTQCANLVPRLYHYRADAQACKEQHVLDAE